MEQDQSEDLGGIAYGLFEHFLTLKLHENKTPLFKLIEENISFEEKFMEIYSQFCEQFSEISEYMKQIFSSPDEMYRVILEGEGVTPSKTKLTRWIVQDAPDCSPHSTEGEKAGKWMVFVAPEDIDRIWASIRKLTWEGELGISSKCSTAKRDPEARDNRWVIFIYTNDWEDEADVMRVRDELKLAGIEERIGYKRNIETFAGEYSAKGKKVTFYSV